MTKIGVGIVLIILSILIGFVIGRANPGSSPLIKTPGDTENVQTTKSLEAAVNPLFKAQSAVFQGTITNITGKNIKVEAENGEKGEFTLSDNLTIYQAPKNNQPTSPSQDINLLEKDKMALITLELVGNKYQATAISYF